MRNLLTRVPKAAQANGGNLVRTIFAQPDATQVRAQFPRHRTAAEQFPATAEFLIDAETDLLAFSSFPAEHWRQTGSIIRRNDSTKSSAAGPTSFGISRTGPPVSASSDGPRRAARRVAVARRYMSPTASPRPACA